MITSLKVLVLCVVVLSPVVLALLVAFQVYVEAILDVKGRFTEFPLQIVAVLALVIVGVGTTTTLNTCGIPGLEQLGFEVIVGVIV